MNSFFSLLFGFVVLASIVADNVIGETMLNQPSFFSKSFNSKLDSRGPGDIEIGPDPSFQCPVNIAVAPHPQKCDYYYTCYPGYPVTLWKCYSDYLFDLKYFGCNFPTEVDCGNRQRPLPNEPTFTCPTSEGFFPIPNTCGADYYVCVLGSPYVSTCPNGNVFDPVTKVCTPPGLASCTQPFICPAPDGFFPIPGACSNSYYTCIANVPFIQKCPGTSIFDPALNRCVPEAAASCKVATTTTTSPTSTTPTTTTPSTTTRTTTTPSTTTPTTTNPSTTTPTTTTPTTTTPTTTPTTTTPTTTTPSTTTPTTTTPSTTTPTTTTPTTTTPSTTTPTTTTPSTTTPTTTTPTTTTPSTTTPTTTTPTTTTPTTTIPTTTTTKPPVVGPFVCPQEFGYYPVPGVTCSTQYYMCSNSIAYLMSCAPTTFYNPPLQTCDWKENVVGCQGRTKTINVAKSFKSSKGQFQHTLSGDQ